MSTSQLILCYASSVIALAVAFVTVYRSREERRKQAREKLNQPIEATISLRELKQMIEKREREASHRRKQTV